MADLIDCKYTLTLNDVACFIRYKLRRLILHGYTIANNSYEHRENYSIEKKIIFEKRYLLISSFKTYPTVPQVVIGTNSGVYESKRVCVVWVARSVAAGGVQRVVCMWVVDGCWRGPAPYEAADWGDWLHRRPLLLQVRALTSLHHYHANSRHDLPTNLPQLKYDLNLPRHTSLLWTHALA